MLIDSRLGTEAATTSDGVHWQRIGLLVERTDIPVEYHGHVTPLLLPDRAGAGAVLFYGAASGRASDANAICVLRLSDAQWLALKSTKL